MKIITYECDLCKESIPKERILSYYFDTSQRPQKYVVRPILPSQEFACDKHICTECIRNIVDYERQKQLKLN